MTPVRDLAPDNAPWLPILGDVNDPRGATTDESADAGTEEPLDEGSAVRALDPSAEALHADDAPSSAEPDDAAEPPPPPPPPGDVASDVAPGDDESDDGLAPEPPPLPALDASAHAHMLVDPVMASAAADTPLFDATAPLYVASTRIAYPPAAALIRIDQLPTGADPSAGGGVATPYASTVRHAHAGSAPVPVGRRRWFRRTVATVVALLLLAMTGLAIYLFMSASGWRDQAKGYLGSSQELGGELAGTRNDLSGAQAELEAVRAQLATAQERIVELANEKAQLGDEWEITQQLVDYQERVSDAAGQVALALDQCVQGQQEFIGYLQRERESTAPTYDPAELAKFETDVEALCQAASEANIALQLELSR